MGQNLDQIRSDVVKKQKKTCIPMEFFSYFGWGIHLKAKSSGCRNIWMEIEKAKLARNTIFVGN